MIWALLSACMQLCGQTHQELWDAVEAGDHRRVEWALSQGAHPDATSFTENYGEITALSLAVMDGDVRSLEMLAGAGANIEARSERFRLTPLMIAVERGHSDAVGTLIDLGARVDAEDAGGTTALLYAAAEADARIVGLLIDAGAMIDKRGGANRTPLLTAIAHGNTEAAKVLIEAGADVNQQGGELTDMSPLMLAAYRGDTEVVETLLSAGADKDAVSRGEGKTALEYAQENRHLEVVKLLLSVTEPRQHEFSN